MKLLVPQLGTNNVACDLCDSLPLEQVQLINSSIREGAKSLQQLAQEYHLSIDALRTHMVVCREETLDERHLFLEAQRMLSGFIAQFQKEIAEGKQYEFSQEDGIDGRSVIQNLVTMVREQRETIMARNKLRSADEVYTELQTNVVGPLISTVTALMIAEGRRLREELFAITKAAPMTHPRIKAAIDDMLERSADRFVNEALIDIEEKVHAVAGTKKKASRRATH